MLLSSMTLEALKANCNVIQYVHILYITCDGIRFIIQENTFHHTREYISSYHRIRFNRLKLQILNIPFLPNWDQGSAENKSSKNEHLSC